jgi:hypothetical protein
MCSPVWSEFAARCEADIATAAESESMMQFTDKCRASASFGCGGDGLIFEAYEPGDTFDWSSLAGIADTVFDEVWNGWTPVVQHTEARGNIWYQGADQMAAEIPLFSSRDRFVMRFRGTITVPASGEYQFKTASDDGSMLYIDQQEVVNNDGNHGTTEVAGDPVTLAAGPHSIVITFYENGGGEALMVSWTPTPGAGDFVPLSSDVLSNRIGCSCHGGLYFEAYAGEEPYFHNALMEIADTASADIWVAGWMPMVQHDEHTDEIWYENDDAFVTEIDEFDQLDHYVLRWRGQITIATPGDYGFKTASDDGSLLMIDGELVVNNDGNHGTTEQSGTVTLSAGPHDIVIVFFENGGGSALMVSWQMPGMDWAHLGGDILSNEIGCGGMAAEAPPPPETCDGNSLLFEAYAPGDSFAFTSLADIGDTVFDERWNGWDPLVQHRELEADIWYSTEEAFFEEIPEFEDRDRFVMRWRGTFTAPATGEYAWSTTSDDGSMLYINRELIVENDGNHGMTRREGSVALPAGDQDITITMYENGGGSGLEVGIKVPGSADFVPLSADMLSNRYGCTCHEGLYFEAFVPETGFGWDSLDSVSATVTDEMWVGTDGIPWIPIAQHEEHAGNENGALWYDNEGVFVQEIVGFDSTDNFVMRWTGILTIATEGEYTFSTQSDDGSLLYIDGQRVVDNDGTHGMTDRQGSMALSAGAHDFVVAFFENTGGAGLKVSWSPVPGSPLQPITNDVLTNNRGCGGRLPSMCHVNEWVDAPTRLGEDFEVINCDETDACNGHMSKTSRDVRSGNPHETSMLRLPTMATTSPIRRLTFCYEYVVGYGNWGADVPAEVTGPSFTVSIVDDATGEASVVYESPELFEFDYDTCNDNGGWGDDTIVGDGCYSPPVCPDVPVSTNTLEFYVLFTFTNNDRNMHLNEDGMDLSVGLCGTGDCNWQAVPSGLEDDFFMGTALAADGTVLPDTAACTLDAPCPMHDGYDGAGGASTTHRDIRSGNPHFTNTVQLTPIATESPPLRLYFQYSYVVGYGRFGAAVPEGTEGPMFTVGLVDVVTQQETIVYTSPMLDTYDYDTCGEHGGWGADDDVNDGCYSPLVPVDAPVPEGFTSTEFVVRFTFHNNDRNMHLNEDGMNMAVAVCPSGDTSTLLPPPPPPRPPANHPDWPVAPPPGGPFHCGTGGPDTDDPSTDGYDYCGDNTVCPCGRCCYCECDVPPPANPVWYQLSEAELTAVQAEQACRAEGGHLASIHSEADEQRLAIPAGTQVWIGLHSSGDERTCSNRQGAWSWFDGTTPDFAWWGEAQPDNDGGDPTMPCSQACVAIGETVVGADGAFSIGSRWSDEDCGTRLHYVCGFGPDVPRPPPPPAVPPPPPPAIPDRPELLVPPCAKPPQPEVWATAANWVVDDGSPRPDNWENTDLKLCWTKSYLKILAVATDSEIISNQPNCGDSTWNGDSIESFIAPGEADPTAWMEMDVSAAGGMYFAGIHGQHGYGGATRISDPVDGGGPCEIEGVTYSATETTDARGQPAYRVELQVAWHLFYGMEQFADELSAYSQRPPRVWRANFYRTNFFSTGQRNPTDYYAWHQSVPLGSNAAFHKPDEFGVLRLVDSAPGGGGGH